MKKKMYYLRTKDGIGSAKTDSEKFASALITEGSFELCSKEEYLKAVRKGRTEDEKAAAKGQ